MMLCIGIGMFWWRVVVTMVMSHCWLVVRRKVRKWGVMEEGINVIVGWVCECMTRKFVEGGVKK